MLKLLHAQVCPGPAKPCQDALSVNSQSGRFAVADGVSCESLWQAEFAAFLCQAFTGTSCPAREALFPAQPLNSSSHLRTAALRRWGAALASSWHAYVQPLLADPPARQAWTCDRRKAMAMFAGAAITPVAGGCRVDYLVAGDAFLFLLDGSPHPLGTVITNPPGSQGLPQSVAIGQDDAEVFFGTRIKMKSLFLPAPFRLLLATDALGRFLRHVPDPGVPSLLRQLEDLPDQPAFARWVADQQTSGALDDDDVSLVLLET